MVWTITILTFLASMLIAGSVLYALTPKGHRRSVATHPFVQRYNSSRGREIRHQTKRDVARHARERG